jgi:hypothetical protein
MQQQLIKEWAITVLYIVLVVSLGLFALNQFMLWKYNSYLLQAPCNLCIELNPNYTRCPVVTNIETSNQLPVINWSSINVTTGS